MRDAASGLGRISGENGRSAFAAAGLRDAVRPQGTSLTIAQGTTTGVRSGGEQQDEAAQGDAAGALSALYRDHYASLVRVAALLTGDLRRAQKIVEDSFVAMHAHWRRLNDQDMALVYLRRCVIRRSRSVFPRRRAGGLPAPSSTAGTPGAAEPAVMAALRALSHQEREVLVLRYYAELPDTQIASAMGVSQAAVKSHATRAMSALHGVLEREP
jgi:DNA-directed RNA polymerase specialized sigma24 family protein